MKLETIKRAIKEWQLMNDYADTAYQLLNKGVFFKINPQVLKTSSDREEKPERMNIHAYPGIVEGELKFFLINSLMDKKEHFEDNNNPISNYIFVADLENMNECLLPDFENIDPTRETNINPVLAKEGILNWALSKESWIKNQVNNTEGLFRLFIIPAHDINPDSEIYGFPALFNLKKSKLNIQTSRAYIASLVVWNKNTYSRNESGLYDLVRPVPPFDPIKPSSRTTENFYLLNIS